MKNIVLIITDTFRYDNLGDKAQRLVRTPELDRFIREKAITIDNFYTGSFPTIPHRTDLASGVLGWPHYGWQSIEKSGPNHIASILGRSGYATQLICDCPHLFNSDFQHDFDAAYQHRGQEGDKPLLHLNDEIKNVISSEKTRISPSFRGHALVDQHRWTNRYFQYESETFSAKTADTTVRWLEENSEADPFFLWTDFFDPHEPWDPPEYLVKRYQAAYKGEPMLHPNYGHAHVYSQEELKNLWAHYAAEAELVDRHIGKILQKIDDLQLWDDTIVIITSDHGTSLGEHERTGKSNISENDDRFWPIYPEVGHVPFLIAGGNLPRGQELNIMAQPYDILPTLIELAGIAVETRQELQGKSFAENLFNVSESHSEYVISGSNITGQDGKIPQHAVTPFLITDKWGYAPVGAYGKPELYDIKADPLAENDMAQENKQVIDELHDLLIDHLHYYGAPAGCMSLWDNKC